MLMQIGKKIDQKKEEVWRSVKRNEAEWEKEY